MCNSNNVMCNVQQPTSFTFYVYTFSHVVIHLYHFAYLTVDITFVVEDIDQLKPLSEPFTFQVFSISPDDTHS